MSKLLLKACPLCGYSHLTHAMTCTDFYATGEEFDIMQCPDCGFKFTQSVPDEANISRYYDSPDYISHSDTQKGLMNAVYHKVRRYMLGRKARIVERESGLTTGRLLDIGTGTGYFSALMQQLGWNVSAIEKNAAARKFALERFNLEVMSESSLPELPVGSFDVITLWHVMEHLEHLQDTWEKLYQLLDSRGVLIVAVPNSDSYDARKYKEHWAAYDVPRHLWHFTADSIHLLASQHNFELCNSYPMPFDAFYISMLSEKYRKSSLPMVKGLLTGVAAGWSSLKEKENSSSMIYIFRKKTDESTKTK